MFFLLGFVWRLVYEGLDKYEGLENGLDNVVYFK